MKSQEIKNPSTTGGKFRRILTEMKDQVREIKLEKRKLFWFILTEINDFLCFTYFFMSKIIICQVLRKTISRRRKFWTQLSRLFFHA